jgi:hypothetical protein
MLMHHPSRIVIGNPSPRRLASPAVRPPPPPWHRTWAWAWERQALARPHRRAAPRLPHRNRIHSKSPTTSSGPSWMTRLRRDRSSSSRGPLPTAKSKTLCKPRPSGTLSPSPNPGLSRSAPPRHAPLVSSVFFFTPPSPMLRRSPD